MKYCILLSFTILCFLSCSENQKTPDVSNVKAPIHVYRFSQDLFNLDTSDMLSGLNKLQKSYPAFFPLYFKQVMPILQDTSLDAISADKVRKFITDDRIRKLYDTTQLVFKDFSQWKNKLHTLNKFMKYYFPKEETPTYYTFLSEYAYASFIFNDTSGRDGIGLGLDMFLGNSYNYIRKNPYDNSFSDYLNWQYTPDFLVKRAAEVWVADKIAPPKENRLLDRLIYEGKKIYILDKLIPALADTVLYGYRPAKLKWVQENEQNMWAYLLSEDLIFSHDYGKINKLINPSPHTTGMPPEAPGQAVLYCAYKIIYKYMSLHPDVTLLELCKMTDAQKILSEARYKPNN